MHPAISIIIVNYKTPGLLLRCIESIKRTIAHSVSYEVIVVDNASNDSSEAQIISQFPDTIWINKKENDGFGRANNVGIKASKGKYLLLLNSDMVLAENTVEACLTEIEKSKTIGVLGCKLLNDDGSIQKSLYYYVADYTELLNTNIIYEYIVKSKPTKIKAVMGAFMLIPRSVIEDCGMFDPDFFMYSEELEWCNRIAHKGYEISYNGDVLAYHKHAGSSTDSVWVMRQKYLSNALLFYKIRGIAGYILYHLLFLLNTVTNFIVMWRFDKTFRNNYWKTQKGYFSNIGYYLMIPFIYSQNIGDGKKLLRRS